MYWILLAIIAFLGGCIHQLYERIAQLERQLDHLESAHPYDEGGLG